MPRRNPVSPDQIDSAVSGSRLVEIVGRDVKLRADGKEFIGLCPFHAERTPSFKVVPAKGFYHCFGCGAHGDAIDYVVATRPGMGFKDAVAYLTGSNVELGPISRSEDGPREPADLYEPYVPVVPVPDDVPAILPGQRLTILNPKRIEGRDRGRWPVEPAMVFPYRLAGGELYGYVLRQELADGRKVTPMVMWCRCPDGSAAWVARPFPAPRPLYGLPDISARPDAPVIGVEGEKAADAARPLFPDAVVFAWPGGTNAIGAVDWEPLRGRRVAYSRDNDLPGLACVAGSIRSDGTTKPGLVDLLAGVVAGLQVVEPPSDAAPKWDIADQPDWTPADAREWFAASLRKPETYARVLPIGRAPDSAPPADEPPPPTEPPGPTDYEPPEADRVSADGPLPLGYDSGVYVYLSRATNQLLRLTPAQHNKQHLIALASLPYYWERTNFRTKQGIAWDAAADHLMRACEAVGVFRPDRIRGRGAWLDGDRPVLHLGETLMVGGQAVGLRDLGSRYVYQAAEPMMDDVGEPLSNKAAHRLAEICTDLRWEKKVSGRLLSGWIAIAPICGAMRWRPSIWLTGPSGSGKSYVFERILRASLGGIALPVQSKTSEAGIRQTLGSDARPVIFDEAEQEDLGAKQRMQGVLDLVRQASSESGAEIVKGSQDQRGAKRYRVRSSFAFCSINVGIEQYADETRITVLSLTAHDPNDEEQRAAAEEHFEKLDALVEETITPDFAAGLVARSVRLMPVILENHKTFTRAVARHLGTMRIGEQIGALLAGAYSLHSTKLVTLEEAEEFVRKQDWGGSSAAEAVRDEYRLLAYLMERTTKVALHSGQATDRTFAELIELARSEPDPKEHAALRDKELADQHLKRCGFRYEPERAAEGKKPAQKEGVSISDTHNAVKYALSRTPWASRWALSLSRLPGAIRLPAVRFGPGSGSRAVFLPIATVLGEEDANNEAEENQ